MEDNDDRSEIANWEEQDTDEVEPDVAIDEEKEVAGQEEVYCTSCGRTIKEAAEMCPHCGVKQTGSDTSTQSGVDELSERRQYELEKSASKSGVLGALLGFFFPPFGYVYVGKWGWALLNFITINYFLLGFILVPLHVLKIVSDAKSELRMAGVGGY